MKLQELLADHKKSILNKWIDLVLASYHADAVNIFKKQKNRFANPVGYNVSHALDKLYQAFVDKTDLELITPVLANFVKIRAVQTFSPSEAVSFVYILKQLVKEYCFSEGIDTINLEDWLEFEARADRVAYTVFDLYLASRERLYQVRINEIKSGNHMMTDSACPSVVLDQQKGDGG